LLQWKRLAEEFLRNIGLSHFIDGPIYKLVRRLVKNKLENAKRKKSPRSSMALFRKVSSSRGLPSRERYAVSSLLVRHPPSAFMAFYSRPSLSRARDEARFHEAVSPGEADNARIAARYGLMPAGSAGREDTARSGCDEYQSLRARETFRPADR